MFMLFSPVTVLVPARTELTFAVAWRGTSKTWGLF